MLLQGLNFTFFFKYKDLICAIEIIEIKTSTIKLFTRDFLSSLTNVSSVRPSLVVLKLT